MKLSEQGFSDEDVLTVRELCEMFKAQKVTVSEIKNDTLQTEKQN